MVQLTSNKGQNVRRQPLYCPAACWRSSGQSLGSENVKVIFYSNSAACGLICHSVLIPRRVCLLCFALQIFLLCLNFYINSNVHCKFLAYTSNWPVALFLLLLHPLLHPTCWHQTVRKHFHFQIPVENSSVQTHLILLCCLKCLCIFGPIGAIQIRYYYYYYYY